MNILSYNISVKENKVVIEVGYDKIENEEDAKNLTKQVVKHIYDMGL